MIITPVKHNIFEGKTKYINNFYIICFTICFNGIFKYFDMNIWVKILNILKIVKWLMIRSAWCSWWPASLLQKWGVIYKLKSLWDLKSEISSLHFIDFTLVKVISL